MGDKRPLAIVLGVTNSWAFAAGTVLLGVKASNQKLDYDVFVYHQGLSSRNRELLDKIHPCTFRDYDIGLSDIDKFSRVSGVAFARYECFGLLDRYREVVWLDSDVLIKGDIVGLLEHPISGLSMYKHPGIPISVSFSDPVPGYDMERECFNDGVFVVTDSLHNSEALREWCYRKTREWSGEINSDQAIINLLLQEFNLTVSEMDLRYNCPPYLESAETRIVHPWGETKFWNGHVHPLWDRYYFRWRAMGGDGPDIHRVKWRHVTALRICHRNLCLRRGAYSRMSRLFASALRRLGRAFSLKPLQSGRSSSDGLL